MKKLLLLTASFLVIGSSLPIHAKGRGKTKSSKSSKQTSPKGDPQTAYIQTVQSRLTVADKALISVIKTEIDQPSYASKMQTLAMARKAIDQVQAINPVPKSLAKADKFFGEWALQMGKALDAEKDGDFDVFRRISDDANIYRSQGMDELKRMRTQKTAPKKYVDG